MSVTKPQQQPIKTPQKPTQQPAGKPAQQQQPAKSADTQAPVRSS